VETYIVSIVGYDYFQNARNFTFNFTADSEAPLIEPLTPRRTNQQIFEFRVTDPDGVNLSLIGLETPFYTHSPLSCENIGSGYECESRVDVSTYGNVSVEIYAEDILGNNITFPYLYTYDPIPPSIVAVTIGKSTEPNLFAIIDPFVINVELTEEGLCKHSLDNVPYEEMGSTVTDPDMIPKISLSREDGFHELYLACRDIAGNPTGVKHINLTVNTQSPYFQVSSPVKREIALRRSINFTGTGDDDLDYVFFNNGFNELEASGPVFNFPTGILAPGLYEFQVEATDDFLRTIESDVYKIYWDEEPPVLVDALPTVWPFKDYIDLRFAIEDYDLPSANARVKISNETHVLLDTELAPDCTGVFGSKRCSFSDNIAISPPFIDFQQYLVEVEYEDIAGNNMEESWNLNIDSSYPVYLYHTITDGGVDDVGTAYTIDPMPTIKVTFAESVTVLPIS